MTDPVVIWDEHRSILSILPVITAAVIFLVIGFVCAVRPYLVQREAVRLHTPPFSDWRDWRVPFFESRVYVVMLRLIGVVSLVVGLGLAVILIGSVFVPGFAKFR